MSKRAKVNLWKCIMGVMVLAFLFVGTWAAVRAPRSKAATTSNAPIGEVITDRKNSARTLALHPSLSMGSNPTLKAGLNAPQGPFPWDAVFEIEGDADNNTTAGTDDWNDLNPSSQPDVPFTGSEGNSTTNTYIPDPAVRTDKIYTGGGSKDFNDLSSWGQVARGTGPDKDDITHAYAARYGDILVFGGDRPTSHGDANIGFWFFQNEVGTNDSGGFTGVHANGDLFVLSAFSGGGGTSTIRVLIWVGTPNPAAPAETNLARCNALGGVLDPAGSQTLCDVTGDDVGTGFTNGDPADGGIGPIHVVWPYKNKDNKTDCPGQDANGVGCTIPNPDFFEGALDLSKLPGGEANACFASFLLETRSSTSVSAVLKDFALGQFEACNLECSKIAAPSPVCEGSNVTYTYTATIPAGNIGLDVTMRDDIGSDGDTTNDIYIIGKNGDGSCITSTTESSFNLPGGTTFSCTLLVSNLAAGTHKDKLFVTGEANGDVVLNCESDEVTVVVNPNPDASANTTAPACVNPVGFTSHDFTVSGTVANGTPSWSIVGANSANCSVFSGGSTTTATIRCTSFGTSTARLTSTSNQTPSCGTDFADVALTLNPNATANAGSPQEACETAGFAFHEFTMAGSFSGGTANWAPVAPNTANCTVVDGQGTATPKIRCTAFGSSTIRLTTTSNTTPACNNATSDVVLTVNQNPVVTIADVACNAASGGTTLLLTAVVSAGGGASPTFTWNGPSGGITAGQGTDTITVNKPGQYSVTVNNVTTSCSAIKLKNVGLCASDPAP